jgi:ribosomal protein S18 acetylase RimI-like enzyme
MVNRVNLSIRVATDNDKRKLSELVHFEALVHRHLDWRAPLDWIGCHPFLIAETQSEAVAALACPPDPSDIAWIRLFAIASGTDPTEAWQVLWDGVLAELSKTKNTTVAAIPVHEWFQRLLLNSGFELVNRVMMLLWERNSQLISNRQLSTNIRPMKLKDLPVIEKVDQEAFDALWHNSLSSLEIAFRQAAIATVVEQDQQVVGYQISTATQLGGHLARLAILPEFQGKGYGTLLLNHLLIHFERRGALQVTVNTQEDNYASLSMYQRAGFNPTGESFPVYQYPL